MEEKEFDINNEEGILAKFDFYYCYNSEQCPKELCMFFNDISLNKRKNFDKRQAFIDLGRIAITLNQQDKLIKELEEENGYIIFADGYDENGNEIRRQEFVKYKDKFQKLVEENKHLKEEVIYQKNYVREEIKIQGYLLEENQQLKQSQKQLAIEELKKLKLSILDFSNGYWHYFGKTGDAYMTSSDIESCLKEVFENQIKKLRGESHAC